MPIAPTPSHSILALAAMLTATTSAHAASGKVLHPVPLSAANQAGQGLADFAAWPKAMMVKPIAHHKYVSWYVGEKLTSMVYEASDGEIRFTDLPYDEHIHLLHGRAILTSLDGKRMEFKAGDTFVAPKGWSGTWELKDGYREEITFETNSINYAMKLWFGE